MPLTEFALQASEDIGKVAAAVFNVPLSIATPNQSLKLNIAEPREISPQGAKSSLGMHNHDRTRRSPQGRYRRSPYSSRAVDFWLAATEDQQSNPRAVRVPDLSPSLRSNIIHIDPASSITNIELIHHTRTSGGYPEFEEERARANAAFQMRSYAQFVKDGLEAGAEGNGNKEGWNNLSIMKLITGKV